MQRVGGTTEKVQKVVSESFFRCDSTTSAYTETILLRMRGNKKIAAAHFS